MAQARALRKNRAAAIYCTTAGWMARILGPEEEIQETLTAFGQIDLPLPFGVGTPATEIRAYLETRGWHVTELITA